MTHQEVLDLERDFWLVGGGNPTFWREHCADDAVIALPMGIMGKADTVTAMHSSDGWETVQFDDVHEVATGDTVIISYRATGRAVGDLDDYTAVVSSAYTRRDGEWQLVFHQQAPTM